MKAHPVPDTALPRPRTEFVVAIDGPAGAGKSTVARLLAARLDYLYLDTGALYRALAWKVQQRGLSPADTAGLQTLLAQTTLDVRHEPSGGMCVVLDGREMGTEIRQPEISALASVVSAVPLVREWLLPVQRTIGARGGVVAEGRDVGTRVFPSADVKFFLEASTEIRAQRRYRELREAGRSVSLEQTQQDIAVRDQRDRTRETAPLMRAADAVAIDTSAVDPAGVVERMLDAIAAKR